MKQITKAIRIDVALASRIQEMARAERRSFAREAQVLLESALTRLKGDQATPEMEEKTA